MATFTWNPDTGAAESREPRIRSARFGDGYEQRAASGINADLATWNLSFSGRSDSEASAILAFLVARGGHESFDWTPPGGSATKWICRKWSRRFTGGTAVGITADFEQVPA